MMRGYQSDPIKEHAHSIELAAAVRAWADAENTARHEARRALDAGCRAQVVADAVGMSRATFYRWMSSDYR